MQKYEKLEKNGEGKRNCQYWRCTLYLYFSEIVSIIAGTYGTVFKAKNRETLEIVAMKRVRLDDDDEVRIHDS